MNHYKKQYFIGWVCRCWIERSNGEGWTSTNKTFDTEQEAREYGAQHLKGIHYPELSREFEIFKNFTSAF